jgi:predicted nucleotidyltransferase
MIKQFEKFTPQSQFEPIKSFYLQDDLNRDIWDDSDEMFDNLRHELLEIAYDYLDFLDIEVDIEDIILTGSLANYNWSKYSDFDVHLVFDFSEVDDNVDLVKKYLDSAEKVWKFQHDLSIKKYPVELYCQDINAEHTSTGVYSLISDSWFKKPKRENFVPDEDLIKIKSEKVMNTIKDLENDLERDKNSEYILKKLSKIWKRIKDARQAGLEKEGEFSIENLIFKLLRRNGYIQRILDVKKKAYDKQFK